MAFLVTFCLILRVGDWICYAGSTYGTWLQRQEGQISSNRSEKNTSIDSFSLCSFFKPSLILHIMIDIISFEEKKNTILVVFKDRYGNPTWTGQDI